MPFMCWRKLWLGLVLAIAAGLLLSGCSVHETKKPPEARNGTIDLTGWDWAHDPLVPLSGEWRFQWQAEPDIPLNGTETTIRVPGMWGAMQAGDGRTYPDEGAAVYRLTVLHGSLNGTMAIRVPNILTAYELYIDGKKVFGRGQYGRDAAASSPYQTPGVVQFVVKDGRTELELKISNFDHRRGGIRTEFILGTAERIELLETRQSSQELIVIGALIMIGLYHIGLFVLRRKEAGNLFFALLCLFMALRTGVIGEGFIVRWFPSLTWEWGTRLDYIALALSAWFGFAYYQRMYPHEMRRFWVHVSGSVALGLCAVTVAFPPLKFTSWLIYYQAYLMTICIVILAALILAWVRRREGARLALIGVAGVVAAIVNDILFYNGWWLSFDLVPFGLLFLIIMNSFIMALRASRTFEKAEQLSAELKQWNVRLEEKIEERTEELRKSYMTLEEAKTGLERMEASRRQLVSNISHDLRSPITLLQGYLEALRDGVISGEDQRDATIRKMLGKVEGLNGLIHDLFELSVLEAGRVELSLEKITLAKWKDRLQEQFAMDMRDKGMDYSCVLPSAMDGKTQVFVDLRRMDRVFENLLFNAVRYTPKGGEIRVALRKREDSREVEITVEDSGTGLHPDDLPHIFERFYKTDKSRHSSSGGSGLGLAISKEIVELHRGAIGAYNRQEGGGGFRITLPISK
ncbi:ATP-binding protein [Cohnella pontilimi]|nr:ATP-binding protein [Cohnella pontilimi]